MILIIILLIFLLLALWWEAADYKRINELPKVEEPVTPEAVFYACLPYDNNVAWRSVFIASIISLFFIWIIVEEVIKKHGWDEVAYVLIFLAIFLVAYVVSVFRSYHYYRPICSKVRPDLCLI